MPARVLDQVPHQPTQERAIADQAHRLAVDGRAASGRLLGREPEQVDRLAAIERATGLERVEPTREQELADQVVELGDVARDARAQLRSLVAAEQLDRHADPRERRAQLVRGRCQRAALRGDQLLDLRGGAVEAPGQVRDLVRAAHLDARRQIARAERLDLRAELLEPTRDAPRDRIGAERDRGGQGGDREQKAEVFVLAVRDERASVGERKHESVSAVHAVAPELVRVRSGHLGAHVRDQLPVGGAQRQVEAEIPREQIERDLRVFARRVRRRQHAREHRRDAAEGLSVLVARRPERAPAHGEQDREHDQDRDDHEIDLQVQPSHQGSPSASVASSWRRANT